MQVVVGRCYSDCRPRQLLKTVLCSRKSARRLMHAIHEWACQRAATEAACSELAPSMAPLKIGIYQNGKHLFQSPMMHGLCSMNRLLSLLTQRLKGCAL